MHHSSVHQSDPNWGSLLHSPHKIRPPDSKTVGTYSRCGAWLSCICFFLFISPSVGSDFISVFDSFARYYAERILSDKSEFPRQLEGFELGFVSRSGSEPLTIIYDVSPNNESWLFVTPCSHSNYTMSIQSFVTSNETKELNVTSIAGEKPFDKWYSKIRIIDMKFSSGFGEKINISNWKRQEMHVRNLILGVMRLHIDKSDSLPAVYMIRQYSGIINAFYPRIPSDPSVQICVLDKLRYILSIHISRAFNAHQYCVIINTKENLPNFCSAQLRIDETEFIKVKDYSDLEVNRPTVFNDYYKRRKIQSIKKFKFQCFSKTNFEIFLDRNYLFSTIFINIYAINNDTKFTDSYRPVQYDWYKFKSVCKQKKKKVKIDRYKPHLWIMGNETVLFNISVESNGRYPSKLLYQGCKHSHKQTLHVFQQESQTPLCVEIVHNRLTAFCTALKPGMYRLQHTLSSTPKSSIPVGQLFFLSNNVRPFPHLHCNKTIEFSINLHQAALDESKTQYRLNISFSRVPSPSDVTYYFHIINFRIPNDSKFNQIEFLTQIETKIKAERNFCKVIGNEFGAERIVHKVTLPGRGCSDKSHKEDLTSIPGLFNGNNTYAVLVYFSTSNDYRLDYVQFYSNRIFTMSSEDDVF